MASNNKRGAQGGGSIRKRSDGRWEARYTVGIDPKTGKQIQRSVYGKTQKEVRQQLSKITAEIDDGSYLEPSRMKLSDWLDIWLKDYSGNKKYSTLKGYTAACNTHIKPKLGDVPLNQLNPVMVQKFYNGLTVKNEDDEPLAPKSVKNVHVVLSSSMNQAVKNGLIKENPCEGAVLPRIEKPKIKPLTEEQITALLLAADKDKDYGTLLKVIVLTGMREAEATGLTWDCIDFNRGTITLDKQLQKRPKEAGGYTFTSLKNDNIRVLRPAPFVMNLLKERYAEQIRQAEFASVAWQAWSNEAEHKTAIVFSNDMGGYLNPKQVYLHFKKIAKEIGAPNARVHDLRHTYAVVSLQNGDDVKTVQSNLGHASAAFTLDVYGHVSDKMKDDSAARMERFVQGIISA